MNEIDRSLNPRQRWFADRYSANARFVADLAEPLLKILLPIKGELILDLGCGDGALTKKISDMGALVIGADASWDQVMAARNRGISALVMDGHQPAFNNIFDAIFTNASLHWMTSPDDVIEGIWNSLKPGGRLVGEMGAAGNIASIIGALKEAISRRRLEHKIYFPWYFPESAEYRSKLEAQGFQIDHLDVIHRPTPLPGDLSDWIDTFCEDFLFIVPESDHQDFKQEVVESLRAELYKPNGQWVADYVRLRFSAMKPLNNLWN